MPYSLTVTAAISRLRQGDSGTRRVITSAGEIVELSRRPVTLTAEQMTPEILSDPYLVIVPGDPLAAIEGKPDGTSTTLTATGTEALPPAPEIVDLESLTVAKLRTMAESMGLTVRGTKAELIERIAAATFDGAAQDSEPADPAVDPDEMKANPPTET